MYLEIEDKKELKHRKELVSLIGNPEVDFYWDEGEGIEEWRSSYKIYIKRSLFALF